MFFVIGALEWEVFVLVLGWWHASEGDPKMAEYLLFVFYAGKNADKTELG